VQLDQLAQLGLRVQLVQLDQPAQLDQQAQQVQLVLQV
jgi:hypothetical protein